MGPLEVLIILLFWVAPSIGVAYLGKRRGLSFWMCLVLGLLISWLVVLVVVLLRGQKLDPDPTGGDSEELKTCPECAESVKAAARVCRFCGHRFEKQSSPTRVSGQS